MEMEMETSKKRSESVVSYPEKTYIEEQYIKKKKKSFAVWPTRRKTLQSYISITLGLGKMLQFAAAVNIYGGIVWIPYFTWAVLVGVPLITVEIALAHYINSEMKVLWEMCPVGKGIFYNCLIATFVAAAFSNVSLAYLLHLSIEHQPSSIMASNKETLSGTYGREMHCQSGWFNTSLLEKYNLSTSHKETSFVSGSHELFPFLYLSLICFVILGITCMGVRSLEKFTTFLVLAPYLCAVVFLILTLTLPRSVYYIEKCWKLDWSRLEEFSVWLIAFEHVVVGFATGNLCLDFISVHGDFHDDIMIDVVIVFLTDFLSTLLLSLAVLGLLGTLNYEAGLETEGLPVNDYLALFVCIIQGLDYLPHPKRFWSFLFFTYLVTSKIGSQSFMVASVADAVMSLFQKLKANCFYVTAGLCFVFFLLGSVILFFKIERLPSLDLSFVTIGLLQCVTLFWIYNYQKVCADFHFLMGYKPSLFYQFTWVTLPIIFAVFIILIVCAQQNIDLYVNNALILVVLHLFIYFTCGLKEAYSLWRKGENINVFKTNISWGPTDPLLKQSRIIFKSRIITEEHIYRQKLYKKQLVKPYDITHQNIVQLQ